MNETLVANRYRLLRRLAAGGMGEVHLAAQVGPAGYERVVALKRMLPNLVSDQDGLKLFLDEARLMTQLNHRNICQIVELGEDPEGYFVALEFITGASVYSLLDKLRKAKQTLDPWYAVDIAAQIAEALAYAYSARGRDGQPLHLIHRDVTPHNVLLSNAGDVKLIDFGVAKSSQQQHSTQSGMVKGKMGYLSPEQSRGLALDGRSDLFSLGIMLYEMVSGTNPFAKADLVQMILSIQNDLPAPLGMRNPAWTPIEPVLDKLLAKSPEQRYPDANAAAEALLDSRSTLPRPPQRLGPYVSERFGAEIEELQKSITDSQMRIQADGSLRSSGSVVAPVPVPPAPNVASSPGVPASRAAEMSPTLNRPSPLVPAAPPAQESTVAYPPTQIGIASTPGERMPMSLGATGEESTAKGAKERAAAAVREEVTSEDEPSEPLAKPGTDALIAAALPARSPTPWIIGAGVVGLVAVGGWFAMHASETPAAPAAPVVALTPPAPPTPPTPAPPTPPAITPPAPPPVVAAPVAPVPAPTLVAAPAPVAPTPVAPPVVAAIEPPQSPSATKHGAKPKHGKDAPAGASASAAAVGTLMISGTAHDLTQASGHLDLPDPSGHFHLGFDYAVANGTVKGKLSCTPWALVYVNGPSRGNTKEQAVELPPLGQSPTRVELEHPGLDTSKLVMSFQPR